MLVLGSSPTEKRHKPDQRSCDHPHEQTTHCATQNDKYDNADGFEEKCKVFNIDAQDEKTEQNETDKCQRERID